jgi:hypothetical protein
VVAVQRRSRGEGYVRLLAVITKRDHVCSLSGNPLEMTVRWLYVDVNITVGVNVTCQELPLPQ